MAPVERTPSVLRVVSSHVDLEDVTGRVLFPTPLVGPWIPFERFAETVRTGSGDVSEGHSHRAEEVMSYIVEGPVEYEDDVGRHSLLDTGAVALLTARDEAHHNLMAKPAPRSRWLSVLVRYPSDLEGPPHRVQIARGNLPVRSGAGTIERLLVGPEAAIDSASGLTCVDLEFRKAARCVCPVGVERRAIAYTYEGSVTVGDQLVEVGAAALLDGVREASFAAKPGSRVLLASAPRSPR